jgi:hypothetical protein
MRKTIILAAVAAALAPLPLLGASFAPDNAPAVEENPDEVICRTIAPPSGSRLGARRTCATRARWRELDLTRADSRRGIEQIQTQRVCRPNDCR